MKAVVFTAAGGNDVVEVLEREDPLIAGDEVLIDVSIAGLNPADLQQREGRYPAPPGVVPDVPGLEVAGTVVEAGEAVSLWLPGDRVFGLVAGGGLASRVAVHERNVTRVPEHFDDQEAAATPEVFITAHDALTTQGELRAGETVLVQGSSGAVGSAAVQIARALGADVLGVVRSDRAAELVRSLGAEPIEAETFGTRTLERTAGRGVDLVLELVGASNIAGDLDVLALRGRVVVVSVAAGSMAEVDLLRLMVRRATIRGTVLRARPLEEKAAAVEAFKREVVPMLADGRARPLVDSVFAADDVRMAFDRLAEPGRSGKVLVSFP
jgi:NADPH:quinone reductase